MKKGVCNVAIEPFSEHNRKRDEVRVGEVSVGSWGKAIAQVTL